jgi:predicted RNA-binding Zn-ribbon protein involved in translation (DUF1610 family)
MYTSASLGALVRYGTIRKDDDGRYRLNARTTRVPFTCRRCGSVTEVTRITAHRKALLGTAVGCIKCGPAGRPAITEESRERMKAAAQNREPHRPVEMKRDDNGRFFEKV